MKLGRRTFASPLLSVEANGGCRYALARAHETGEVWYLSVDPKGGVSGGPLPEGIGGGSTEPFEEHVLAGRLAPGSEAAEIVVSGGARYRADTSEGVWLVAIPWFNRDTEISVEYLDAAGAPVSIFPAYQLPRVRSVS